MSGEYYNTKESVKEYIKAAKDFNGSQLIEKLSLFLPEESSLLEIGSGPGTDWRILNKLYKVTGSDFSREFLDHLETGNPNGEFIELDAVTLFTDKKFDGIYSNKVLHHLKDSEIAKSVKRQYDILNSRGIVCHSFWKGTGNEHFKGLFVNYHMESDLEKLFHEFFQILLLETYTEFEDGDSILLIAKRK
jgi:cyclopropane fatty-acyl-phospholipid synthase-like methyltransferase